MAAAGGTMQSTILDEGHTVSLATTGGTSAPLAVVTVSFYSGQELGDCLRSLDGACQQRPHVYVVNNAPEDPLRVTQTGGRVEIVKPGVNLGYGSAINRAVQLFAADTEWMLITNPDVV